MKRVTAPLLLLVASVLLGTSSAQLGVGTEVPEASVITVSNELVRFDLAEQGYPPPDFPHYYLPSAPTEPVLIRLFSNYENGWILEADFATGLVGPAGREIPPGQLEYSLDGGPWLPFAPRVSLMTSQGASNSFEEHTLEFRLQLLGNEAPGTYRGVMSFILVQF